MQKELIRIPSRGFKFDRLTSLFRKGRETHVGERPWRARRTRRARRARRAFMFMNYANLKLLSAVADVMT